MPDNKEPVTLRDALSSAIDDANKSADTVVEPVQEVEEPNKGSKPGRDESGKFSKKEKKGNPDEPGEDPPVDDPEIEPATIQPQDTPGIEPESHWSDQDKQAFRSIPPEHRSWVMERYKRLEADNTKKSQEAASLRSLKQNLDAVFEPYRAEMQAQGLDEVQSVRTLLGIRDQLRRDPTAGLMWLANQFGVDLTKLATDPPDPTTLAVQQTESKLGGRLQQLEQQLQGDRMQHAFRMLDSFAQEKDANGLTHPHFEAVVNDMTQLMKSGMVPLGDLNGAYQKALLLHPELTTPATQTASAPATPASAAPSAAQAPDPKKDALDKATEAARAKKAAAGVSGSGNGKAESSLSLRDELAARLGGSMR